MRIKQMIIQSNFTKMKNIILPICLQGNYRDSLGEFSNTSYGAFGAETDIHFCAQYHNPKWKGGKRGEISKMIKN